MRKREEVVVDGVYVSSNFRVRSLDWRRTVVPVQKQRLRLP